jgi:histidinol-phosphate aminotransferase
MTTIVPKSPSGDWLNKFLSQDLLNAKAYSIADASTCSVKLDQNESPFDWPPKLKNKILEQMLEEKWNRYPEPYPQQLTKKVAEYAGVHHSNILLCGGSNYHISIIISMLSQKIRGDLVVARPSFPLYEAHCRYSAIKYKTWDLSEDLEYDIGALADLRPGSIVIFASPNNPTGSSLSKSDLEKLLQMHPQAYFIADEAYYEFCDQSYTSLLTKYSNLVIVRTFSKAFSAAGVRLGYTIAAKEFIEECRKLTLPFVINRFTIIAFLVALNDKEFLEEINKNVKYLIKKKDNLYIIGNDLLANSEKKLYPSFANFLFLRCGSLKDSIEVAIKIQNHGCLVRPIASSADVFGVRLTVGSERENELLLEALRAYS